MLHIEYVCTGNNGRSPMVETIAKAYVSESGLQDIVVVSSSGSGLNALFQPSGDAAKMEKLSFISLGLHNRVYGSNVVNSSDVVNPAIRSPYKTMATSVLDKGLAANDDDVQICLDFLIWAEGIFRNMALANIGLMANGTYHTPTEPRGDVNVVLPMAHSNVVQVRAIYEGSRFAPPHIEALNQYVQMEGDVPNPFCQLLPAYEQCRDYLMVAVPKTIDRAVREILG